MKAIKVATLTITLMTTSLSVTSQAGVICNVQSKIKSLVPSLGDAGVFLKDRFSDCSCGTNQTLWIDLQTPGGQAMFDTALAAKIENQRINVTFEDGLGKGSPSNDGITNRFQSSCKIKALQIF